MTILCLAGYEKGHDFLRQAKLQGAHVILVTSESLRDTAQWPHEAIDEIFYMPNPNHEWNRDHTLFGVCHLARTRQIDRLVPLDDFDLEIAAFLREHLRIPGMGETTTRYFRDKLAMRMRAAEAGLNVPEFVHLLNFDHIREFTERVPPPWLIKPRSMAGAIGIKIVTTASQLWDIVHSLGDQQSFYLAERFVPGDICHVDCIVYEREILFTNASRYGKPPLEVSQQGDIFTTTIVERGSVLETSLLDKNARVMTTMGMLRGVSHTEFIVSRADGKVYFLETSARVGGAHIADLIEQARGINLWREWAKIELAGGKAPYTPPQPRNEYGALMVSLAREEFPDTSSYNDPEIVWRMNRKHHVGLILRSPNLPRIQELVNTYVPRIRHDYHAVLPPQERPTN